jgi:phosphoglycolate phosphatase
MLKLIVFDWDGTLANSVGKIIECKKFLANKYNLPPPSEETVRSVLGLKFESAMAICFPTVSSSTLLELGKEFNTLMQQDTYQADLFPNVKEALATLKEQKFILAIATSKARCELDKALLYTGLTDSFDATCCSEEYEGKPLPAMLHHLMKQYKLQPDECLMIGDTTIDIIFAQNAGIKTICVTFGANTVTKLKAMKPLALIDDWLQLPKIINKIRDKQCHQKSQTYCRL